MVTIHEFNPLIYPRMLWVSVGIEQDQLVSTFSTNDIIDSNNNLAECLSVEHLSTGSIGVLCNFGKIANMTSEIISHESSHCADYIFDECGMVHETFSKGNEHYAFLCGWVAKCMSEVRRRWIREIYRKKI